MGDSQILKIQKTIEFRKFKAKTTKIREIQCRTQFIMENSRENVTEIRKFDEDK